MTRAGRWTFFSIVLFCGSIVCSSPRGRVIKICDDIQEPVSLNPYQIFSEKAHIVIQQFMEGLIRFDADGKIEPVLARDWQRLDPLRMRFHLRPNVVFHNGERLTAKTVKFSIERYIDPKVRSPAAGFLDSIERVDVIDDNTVDVVTKYPDGLLLNRLAAWVHICPMNYFEEVGDEGFGKAPVGTGPFKFRAWHHKESIEFDAFEGYWDSKLPKCSGLVFKFLPAEKQVDALLAGDIDILTSLPGTRTLEVQMNPKTYVIKKPTLYMVAASINITRGPLANKRVRQALNMAINKEDLVRYDIMGNGRTIAGMSIPGEFGHNKDIRPYPYDPGQAKKILDEEGYPNGFRVKVFLKANAERTGRIMKEHLLRIGVVMDSTVVPDAEIFKYLEDRSQWDILLADCPDPMYHSSFIPTAFLYSKSPFAIAANAEFDRRLEKIIQTLDSDQQRILLEELDSYIHDEALGLFTYQRIRTYGLRQDVEFIPYTSGMPYFLSVSEKNGK